MRLALQRARMSLPERLSGSRTMRDRSRNRRPRCLSACARRPAKKRTIGYRCRARARSWLRCVSHTYPVGQTFSVEPADQFHRHEHVSIGSAGYDWRRDVIVLHHAQSIPAPAESDANVGLFGEAHLIRVNSDPEDDVGRSIACPTNTERRAVGPRPIPQSVWCGARSISRCTGTDRRHSGIVGQQTRARSLGRFLCGRLRDETAPALRNANERAPQRCVHDWC
jgi:hypothetical protein